MKYCAKCGTQMSDDTTVCPKCHPEINKQQSPIPNQSFPTKNIDSKTTPLALINFIISTLTLIAVIVMYFIPPSINNLITSNNNSDMNSTNSNIYNSTCPADPYGNHDWAPAKCTEPSQCYNCDAYRDDKLGQHSFYTHDDGLRDCSYCGILYEVYMNSLD